MRLLLAALEARRLGLHDEAAALIAATKWIGRPAPRRRA